MELKEHLTLQGLQKIINIRATLNFGLSKELQLMFPETIPVPRVLVETYKIPNPQWIAGFGIGIEIGAGFAYHLMVSRINFIFNEKMSYIPSSSIANHRFTRNTLPQKTYIRQFSSKNVNAFLSLAANDIKQTTSLVVWGVNLTSTVGMGRFTKQVREMIQLPNIQKSVVVGLILSDGWLRFPDKSSKNALIGFKQSLAHSDYVWFVFSFLSHYCNITPQLKKGIKSGIPFYGLEFVTRSLPCFTEFYTIFYVNGVKVIPKNIYELLTPVAFAHLIKGFIKFRRRKG